MTDSYRPAGPLFVRTAATPTGQIQLPGGADAVRYVAARPALHEAVEVASTGLGRYVERIAARDEVTGKRLHGTAVSVSRYVLRGCTRATPFGLFAGVARARLGTPARFETTGPGHKQVRADAGWLADRIAEWLRSPEVRANVDVLTDERCQVRGERLVLPGASPVVSLARTPLVDRLCERATRPVPYAKLLAEALADRPDLDPDGVEAVLAQLVEHRVLLTSLSAVRIDEHLLDRLDAALAPLPAAVEELRRFRTAARAYEGTEPGRGRAAWRDLMRAVGDGDATRRPAAQVDLRPDVDVVIPPAVAEEAAAYAGAMWDLTRTRRPQAYLDEYHERFVERYGLDVAVPLGRLVDPHRGLGFPRAYGEDPGASPSALSPAPEPQRGHIAEFVQQAQLDGSGEVLLTPDRLRRLSPAEPPRPGAAPASFDVCLQLLADDTAALDRGDFLLAGTDLVSAGLVTPAGRITGRFTSLVNAGTDVTRLLTAGAGGDTLVAQLTFATTAARSLNVTQVPRLLPYELPVGVFADRDDPGVLHWPELHLSAAATGFVLTEPAGGRPVVPVAPHMLGLPGHAPPVARLLADLAGGGARGWHGWDWCGLDALPALPRVRLGRVVVSPRRWRPDVALRDAALAARPRHEDPAWDREVAAWRDRYGVPDRVVVVTDDRGYVLDLTDGWQRRLLGEEVRTSERCALTEDLGEGGRRFGWSGGRATQVVVPVVRVGPGDRHDEGTGDGRNGTPSWVRTDERVELPAEGWLYAKLYGDEDAQDDLLVTHLPDLLREVAPLLTSWHFLRYRDPEPHLRLRLQGDPPALRTTVLPALTRVLGRMREAGLVRTVEFGSYEPETERYGGRDALADAEHVFGVDSTSVLAQLRLRAAGRLDLPPEVQAAVNHALLLEALGDRDWPAWVERTFPKDAEHATYQRHRNLARSLIRPGATATAAAPRLGPAVTRSWRDAPEPRAYDVRLRSADVRRLHGAGGEHAGDPIRDVAVRSLLHLQHNRLFGVDRDREGRGYAVLRGVAHDHLSRLGYERRVAGGTGRA